MAVLGISREVTACIRSTASAAITMGSTEASGIEGSSDYRARGPAPGTDPADAYAHAGLPDAAQCLCRTPATPPVPVQEGFESAGGPGQAGVPTRYLPPTAGRPSSAMPPVEGPAD